MTLKAGLPIFRAFLRGYFQKYTPSEFSKLAMPGNRHTMGNVNSFIFICYHEQTR